MDPDSGKVSPQSRAVPTNGLHAPKQRRRSRQNLAQEQRFPEPRREPETLRRTRRVPGGKAGDARVAEKSGYCTKRETRIRTASPWRPALPGIPSNSTSPQIPKIPKAKLQAGLQKFGNRLPGFPASCLHSRRQRPATLGGGNLSGTATLHAPGAPPSVFCQKGPQPPAA